MFGLDFFKRERNVSEESKFKSIYLSLIAGVFDFNNILRNVPLVFVDDLPLEDINSDYVYVLVRGRHPYYDLKYNKFDENEGMWFELDLVGMRGLL